MHSYQRMPTKGMSEYTCTEGPLTGNVKMPELCARGLGVMWYCVCAFPLSADEDMHVSIMFNILPIPIFPHRPRKVSVF